jgi:hypothetical protein
VIIPHVFVDPSNIEEGSSMGKDYDNWNALALLT